VLVPARRTELDERTDSSLDCFDSKGTLSEELFARVEGAVIV
jgi:hypothetical protein